VRLDLPVSCPVLPVCDDDAGWCLGSGTFEPSPASSGTFEPSPASLVLV
jgi:hypothetical protein